MGIQTGHHSETHRRCDPSCPRTQIDKSMRGRRSCDRQASRSVAHQLADTCQITVEPEITITAARTTSRDIRRYKASSYRPG
jgi:hypothetical protein